MGLKRYFEIFYIFLKLSAFGLGAASVTIPLIENEVVTKRGWIRKEEFIDIVALAQSAPGPITTKIAVFVGYRAAGVLGMVLTVLGSIITPFICILAAIPIFDKVKDSIAITKALKGIGPVLVAIVLAQAFRFGKTANLNRRNILFPIITVVLIIFVKINPIYIIVATVILGIVYGFIKKGGKRK
ncbi:MAG: chromate transporter [Christensenellales bacterium]|jgi:chromate transporter